MFLGRTGGQLYAVDVLALRAGPDCDENGKNAGVPSNGGDIAGAGVPGYYDTGYPFRARYKAGLYAIFAAAPYDAERANLFAAQLHELYY